MDLELIQSVLNEEDARYQDYELNLFVEVVNDTTSDNLGFKMPSNNSQVLKPGGVNFQLKVHALVCYKAALSHFKENGHAYELLGEWPSKNKLQYLLNSAICDLTAKAKAAAAELKGLV